MTRTELETFIEGATHYFQTAANQAASVGSPYLIDEGAPAVMEYTGVISVAGKKKGVVYFTAPRQLLSVLLMRMGETELSHDNMCDLVGEVANQISGRARRDFGSEFVISVPKVRSGAGATDVTPPDVRSFVIPINWRHHSAQLVVCLK